MNSNGECLYQAFSRHLVAIDSIIFGFQDSQLKLLLTKRQLEGHKGDWSLMGGFVGENESVDNAAARILEELTGLRDIYLEQLYTYGDVNRDEGARVISVAYYALIKIDLYNESLGHKYHAQWFPIEDVPELIFDHNVMINKALRRLQRKTVTQPIGFELLNEKFTLTQLQQLYEAIHQKKLDKRNFRKKILAMDVLQKLTEKDKDNSKRGAFLVRFDKRRYDELAGEGNVFEFK